MKKFVDVKLKQQGVEIVTTQFGFSELEGELLQLEMYSKFGKPWMGLESYLVGLLDPKFGHNLLNWGCRLLFSKSVGDALINYWLG